MPSATADREPDPSGQLQVIASARRRALMDRAVSEELNVLSFHLPFPGLGRVEAAGDGWEWEPVV